jgi:hypothetical protein
MIDLRLKPEALFELQNFIRHYEQAFYELYHDSGVWNEDLIIRSYRESAQKLYLTILEGIKQRLGKKKVLGRKSSNYFQELDFYVGNRLVVVYYSDDAINKARIIESISIDRKPIIF